MRLELRPNLRESSHIEHVIHSGFLSPGIPREQSNQVPLTERRLNLGPIASLGPHKKVM